MIASEELPVVKDADKTVSLKENTSVKEKKISTEPKEKSAYKGVFKCGKKFKAQIQTNRVQHYLGLYDTEIEAARAYDNHARVVLGPRARTNFDYNSSSPTTSGVLVAPIYTRGGDSSSGNNSTEGGESTGPPKRTYVGIKLKRQIMPDGMTNSSGSGLPDEKRQKGLGSDPSMFPLPHGGFNGLYGYGAPNPSGLSHDFLHSAALAAQQQFGASNSSNANSGLNSLSAAAVHATMPGFPGAAASGSVEEQMRWFEQYQHMAFLQQQAFYMQQMQQYHGGASASFNPYMMMPMGGADASSPFSFMGAGMGGVQSPYGHPYQASMMSMPGMGAMGGYPSMNQVLMGAGAGAAASRPMDMSGLLLNTGAGNNNSTPADAASSSTSSVLSAAAASLAAQMSLANTHAPVSATTSTASAPARNDALGHLLTLSEAVSSLPASQTISPAISQNGAPTNTEQASSHRIPLSETSGNMTEKSAGTTQQGTGKVSLDDPEDEDDIDWRDQLYYWTGILTYDPARRVQVWQGSWVGSYTGRPSALDFAESSNRFEYTTTAVRQVVKDAEVPPQSGRLQGFYMMDNIGDGTLEKYEDTEYEVMFEPIYSPLGISEQYAVYGRGDSEFGAFIVTGRYSAHSRVLEMTRQYVADTDLRARLTLQQLREHFRLSSNNNKQI